MNVPEWEQLVRLTCAVVAGAALGFERELRGRPAGIRTHSLVALGAAMFTMTGIVGFEGDPSDPARIAAQVVTGLGFIGAGSIIRDGAGVIGLTTAATVWAAGALGMAFAAGAYVPAGATFVLSIVVLTAYRPLQDLAARVGKTPVVAAVEYHVGHGALGSILTGLEDLDIRFESINIDEPGESLDRNPNLPPGAPLPVDDETVGVTGDPNRRIVRIRMVLTQAELTKLHQYGAKLERMPGIGSVTFG